MIYISMYYVYIIKSFKDGRLYKGFSDNVERRVKEHNSGKVSSTKAYRPWKLVYKLCFSDRQEALKVEKYLKSGSGRSSLKRLISHGEVPERLKGAVC